MYEAVFRYVPFECRDLVAPKHPLLIIRRTRGDLRYSPADLNFAVTLQRTITVYNFSLPPNKQILPPWKLHRLTSDVTHRECPVPSY